jgi:hypothetical protein
MGECPIQPPPMPASVPLVMPSARYRAPARPILGQGLQRERPGQRVDHFLGALFHQPVGPAGSVRRHPAAGDARRGRVDPEVGQHRAAHHAHVPGVVVQPHPPAGGDPVEHVAFRVPAGLVLVIARPDDPAALGGGRGSLGDPPVQLIEAGHPSTSVRASPKPIMWLCASWNPGSSVAPRKSSTARAARPAASAWTPVTRPPVTETAAARGRAASMVSTFALTSSKSSEGTAQDNENQVRR